MRSRAPAPQDLSSLNEYVARSHQAEMRQEVREIRTARAFMRERRRHHRDVVLRAIVTWLINAWRRLMSYQASTRFVRHHQ